MAIKKVTKLQLCAASNYTQNRKKSTIKNRE